jgi:1,4-dihydroxy-6-naphthoate synthase
MFYALAHDKLDTGRYRFTHQRADIETLNRGAFSGQLELTALSLHAYAHLADRYILCSCGASMGEAYGPIVVARRAYERSELCRAQIAVPGTLTTAFLMLRVWLGVDFPHTVVPFDEIIEAVENGAYHNQAIDAGLIIHEGQLTYADHGLARTVDLGQWWHDTTGMPLPLGANAIRKDLGDEAIRDVNRLLRASIQYGLDHRDEALDDALHYGRGLDRERADRFVAMYVNDWTLDFGPRGRDAVAALLRCGHDAGLIPQPLKPEFVSTT